MLTDSPTASTAEPIVGIADVIDATTAGITAGEERELELLEDAIERDIAAFIRVGLNLAEIRDRRLYRRTHRTFEAYVEQRWGRPRQWAYSIIDEASAAQQVSEKSDIQIERRSHAAALADVAPDQRVEVLKEAAASTGGKVTAKSIKKARLKIVAAESPMEEAARLMDVPVEMVEKATLLNKISAELSDQVLAGTLELDAALSKALLDHPTLCIRTGGQPHQWIDDDGTRCRDCGFVPDDGDGQPISKATARKIAKVFKNGNVSNPAEQIDAILQEDWCLADALLQLDKTIDKVEESWPAKFHQTLGEKLIAAGERMVRQAQRHEAEGSR